MSDNIATVYDKQDETKQLQKLTTVSKLNLLANGITAYQTTQVKKAVHNLKEEVEKQTSLLRDVASTNTEILDENKKQTRLMELTRLSTEQDKAIKNNIFNLKITIDNINGLSSNIEKYLMAKRLDQEISAAAIDYNDITEIQDKQFLYNLVSDLKKLPDQVLIDFVESDESALEELFELKQEITKWYEKFGEGRLAAIEQQISEKKAEATTTSAEVEALKKTLELGDDEFSKHHKLVRKQVPNPSSKGAFMLLGGLLGFPGAIGMYFFTDMDVWATLGVVLASIILVFFGFYLDGQHRQRVKGTDADLKLIEEHKIRIQEKRLEVEGTITDLKSSLTEIHDGENKIIEENSGMNDLQQLLGRAKKLASRYPCIDLSESGELGIP